MQSEISVFEVSPTPSGGILILVSNDVERLSAFYAKEKILAASALIDSCLIPNLNPQIIEAYLSQNMTSSFDEINFFESNSLSDGFVYAHKISETPSQMIDFRVIRSVHNRAILVYTGKKIDHRTIAISHPTDTVKEYFLIHKQ